jgi:hypothetical protein
MGIFIDLTGKTFSRLTVISKAEIKRGKGVKWVCRCICGKEKSVPSYKLTTGHTKSCGCYQKERASESNTTHGHKAKGVSSPEYTSWQNMKCRCYDIKDKYYESYGGRGIKVCERWLGSFENFYEDMGPNPSKHHSLDRKEVNGDYEPSNCRWATNSEQSINQRIRHDNTSGHKGVSWHKTKKKWEAWISINKKSIYLGHFIDISKAIIARQQAEIKYHAKLPS